MEEKRIATAILKMDMFRASFIIHEIKEELMFVIDEESNTFIEFIDSNSGIGKDEKIFIFELKNVINGNIAIYEFVEFL